MLHFTVTEELGFFAYGAHNYNGPPLTEVKS
jgi:hypothetical protein